MRPAFLLLLFLAGCATPLPLSQFHGWSWREVGQDRFEIVVGDGDGDKVHEAFLYAASLTLERGYRSFVIMHESGGESGTEFFWNLGYVPSRPARRSGLIIFRPGKFFTIRCEKKRPSDTDALFDAHEQLRRQRPNKLE
jgi:hypothetical protein